MAPRAAPAGTWRSPLRALDAAASGVRLSELAFDGDDLLWLEGRPAEAGRVAVVRRAPDGRLADATPAASSARTRVHEYGGGAYVADAGELWIADDAGGTLAAVPSPDVLRPLTPADGRRYADFAVDRARARLLAVCEDARGGGEPANSLVAIPLAGGEPRPLVRGHDFVSTPRLSPDGRRLAWLSWEHPDMPWDATRLWVAELDAAGDIRLPQAVAGGPRESVFQPEWSPEGVLHFVADPGGWWNLRRLDAGGVRTLWPREAEFGLPQWVFRMSTYAFAGEGRIVCAFCEGGRWRLGVVGPDGRGEELDLPYSEIGSLAGAPGRAAFLAAGPDRPPRVAELDLASGRCRELHRPVPSPLDPAFVSVPRGVRFATEGGATASAWHYPPHSPEYALPPGERPPLLVTCHGGPTACASTAFDPRVQFWTTRGFGVLDVNHRGSSGFGRAFREALRGRWGVADVRDCEAAARDAVARDAADPERLAIRGGSAGGYTALCALTFGRTFRAGASLYGIGDLEALVRETHKFEAHYTDRLVAPYPEGRALYRERSPLHHAEGLACPVIFFQGSEDRVVPPSQAEAMVDALRRRGVPVACVLFEGEGHGFRRAGSTARVLEAELAFYGRVFGFAPADPIEPPLVIWNLD